MSIPFRGHISLFEWSDECPDDDRSFPILGLPGGSIFLPLNDLIAKQGEEVNFQGDG